MGKGLIISGGEKGRYRVEILYNRERYDKQVAALQAKIEEQEKIVEELKEAKDPNV